MAKLIISLSSSESLDFALESEVTRLGRQAANEIVIDNTWISSFHAEFRSGNGSWLLRDLQSSNGTSVNGVRITEQLLRNGDRLAFGQLEAVFVIAPGAPPAAPVAVAAALPVAALRPEAPDADAEAGWRGVQDKTAAAQAELAAIESSIAEARERAAAEDLKLGARLKEVQQLEDRHHLLASKVSEWSVQEAAAAERSVTLAADQARAVALQQEIAGMESRLEHLRRELEGAEALSAKVADLRQQQAEAECRLGFLQDRLEGMSGAPDPDWGTVHSLARSFIKKLDLMDDLTAHLASQAESRDALAQLEVFRSGLLDILKEYSIEAYSLEPGTVIDVSVRKRIQIVETLSADHPDGTRIVRTYRPGYVCQNGDLGIPTLLRKADVAVSMAFGQA